MKLVDILARELDKWPEDVLYAWQSECDNEVYFEGAYAEVFHATENAEDSGGGGSEVTRAQWQAAVDALKAESAPAWVGIGLPPVGTVCEAKTTRGWSMGTIIAHGLPPKENIAVWQEDGERISLGVKEYFRQIRTPEQIAAEERDRSISEMREIWNFAASSGADPFIALHSAGYRKFEIVDN